MKVASLYTSAASYIHCNHTRLLLETCKKWLIIILHAGVCVYVSNPGYTDFCGNISYETNSALAIIIF